MTTREIHSAPREPDNGEQPDHEQRLQILEVAMRVHADQIADVAAILRDLPKQIGSEVRLALSNVPSDEDIDRMVGTAMNHFKRRAYDGANATIWAMIKAGFSRVATLVVLLWLAWTVGGSALMAKVWSLLNSR